MEKGNGDFISVCPMSCDRLADFLALRWPYVSDVGSKFQESSGTSYEKGGEKEARNGNVLYSNLGPQSISSTETKKEAFICQGQKEKGIKREKKNKVVQLRLCKATLQAEKGLPASKQENRKAANSSTYCKSQFNSATLTTANDKATNWIHREVDCLYS